MTRTYTTSADFAEGDLDQPDRHAARPAPARRHDRGVRLHLDRRVEPRHGREDRHEDRRRPRRVLVGASEPGQGPVADDGRPQRQRLGRQPRRGQRGRRRRQGLSRPISASSRTASASIGTATASSTRRPASATSRPGRTRPGVDNDGGVETAADECVIHYVRTNGVAIRQVSVDAENHVWVGGAALGGAPTSSTASPRTGRSSGRSTCACPPRPANPGVVICCYGGLVDPNGILWSSAGQQQLLVRIDPSKPNGHADLMRVHPARRDLLRPRDRRATATSGSRTGSSTRSRRSARRARSSTRIPPAARIRRGVAATADGDIWVANSGGNTVSRLRGSDGAVLAVIPVGASPPASPSTRPARSGPPISTSSTASRINPATNTVDLTVSLGAGANPYNYSDMTGSTLTGAPDDGTWSVDLRLRHGRHELGIPRLDRPGRRRWVAQRHRRVVRGRRDVRPRGRRRRRRGDRRPGQRPLPPRHRRASPARRPANRRSSST